MSGTSFVLALALGGSFGATGSEVPTTTNPPNWSGVHQIRGWGPSARVSAGVELQRWTLGLASSAWWIPSPADVRDGTEVPAGNVALGGGHVGAFGDLSFGPGFFAGLDLGASGLRFRPSDSFLMYTRPGFAFGARFGWQQSEGPFGVEFGTTAHTASNTGPVGTFWSGGEVGLRGRVAF